MWLLDWTYRKSIIFTRSSGQVSNYPVKVTIGETTTCNALCQSTFSDLRFTNFAGTLLDYWIEDISGTSPNQTATIWIELDTISTSGNTFYMYYGNPSAPAYSNGINTFSLFDDFSSATLNTTKWNNFVDYWITIEDGVLTAHTLTDDICGISSKATFNTNTSLRAKVKPQHLDSSTLERISMFGSSGVSHITFSNPTSAYTNTYSNNDSITTDIITMTGTSVDTWITTDIMRNGSTNVIFSIDNANQGDIHTHLPTGNGPIQIQAGFSGEISVDWILVRNYSYPEPVQSEWGGQVTPEGADFMTYDVTNILPWSFTANARILAAGGDYLTRRGFCYKIGTTGDPTIADYFVYEDGLFDAGDYSLPITSLIPFTDYRVRPFASNNIGVFYGSSVSAKTLIDNYFTITCNTGTILVDYTTITQSHASGSANFYSFTEYGCVDGGENVGWIFDREIEVLTIFPTYLMQRPLSTKQFTASLKYTDLTTDVTSAAEWTSSKPYVATISSTGYLTCLSYGKTTITATYLGKTTSAIVQVTDDIGVERVIEEDRLSPHPYTYEATS
jgi:hypothetical protein